MSNVFVQQPAIQKLLRDSAGLDVAGGDERFKAIIHRLLENICTLIDDYNVTEEEFWHAVNYLHELGGQRGYLGENLPWSDLSRGALRWVDGADEHAQHAGFSPRLSGVKSEDEALYIAHHHHWQTLMLAAIEQEQQRYDQSITQRVEVA